MKIKYYLRGLGTGILFATIILTISYATRNDDSITETTTQTTTQTPTEETTRVEIPTEETTTTDEKISINSENISVTVSSGMSSEQVAAALQTNGVIENSIDFDSYLKENGYSKIISVGIYEISANSTYKEIAEIITNTN